MTTVHQVEDGLERQRESRMLSRPAPPGAGNRALNLSIHQGPLAPVVATLSRAGNTAVQRLLVQRQPTNTEVAAREAQNELPPDVLASIERNFPSPDVPIYEVIAGTTAAENSSGQLTDAAIRLWRRQRISLTNAARQVAATNAAGPGAPRGVHSQQAIGQFDLRWGMLWAASNYQTWGDLPDVAELLRGGGPFQRALRGEFSNVINVSDPTGDDMRSSFFNAVMAMFQALPQGQMGQLVVHFQGHGAGDGLWGVDEQRPLTPGELTNWARMARDWNVHVIFILDTCNVGQAVLWAQGEHIDQAIGSVGQLPPGDARRDLDARLATLRAMGNRLSWINYELDVLYDMRRDARTAAGRSALAPQFERLLNQLRQLGDLASSPLPDGVEMLDVSRLALAPFTTALIGSVEPSRALIFQLRRECAPLLDRLSDTVNTLLLDIRVRANSASAAGARTPLVSSPAS